MKFLILRWLGLETTVAYIESIDANLVRINSRLDPLINLFPALTAHNLALGRIVAKLDPLYAVDESDPQRRLDSDRLSNAVIDKLMAEYHARTP